MEKQAYINMLKVKLSSERFAHSLAVMETALSLAENYAVDQKKVWLAALLHDYAKDLSDSVLLKLARENNLLSCQVEKYQPNLLHGPVGAFLCKRDLQIKDQEILQAIYYHTTGHQDMTLLDKIVFLADLLEPERSYPWVDELRQICAANLDKGLFFAFEQILQYLLHTKTLIHPLTIKARNQLIYQRLDMK